MNRQLSLIVFGAVGAFLIAMVGVSAHTGSLSPFFNFVGVQHSQTSDEASGARTEPSEKPETSPESEPTEKPEPTPTATSTPSTDTEPDEDDMTLATPMTSPKAHCEDECGGGD